MGTFGLVNLKHKQKPKPSPEKQQKIPFIYNSTFRRPNPLITSSPIPSSASTAKRAAYLKPSIQKSNNDPIITQAKADFAKRTQQRKLQTEELFSSIRSKDQSMLKSIDECLDAFLKMDLQEKEALEKQKREQEKLKAEQIRIKVKEEKAAREKAANLEIATQKLAKEKAAKEKAANLESTAQKLAKEKAVKEKNAAIAAASARQVQSPQQASTQSTFWQPKKTSLSVTEGSKTQSNTKTASLKVSPPPQIVSDEAWETAKTYLEQIKSIKGLKDQILSDRDNQNMMMKDKMIINRSVGQLNKSQKLLVDRAKLLEKTLDKARGISEQYYSVLMYMAAKKIVKQAETEVSVKPDTSIPLAIVCVFLSNKHPAFHKVLLGRMMHKCPYIVPMIPMRQESEPLIAFQKRLGYNTKVVPVESEIRYGERMGGIISLYAAILQSDIIKNIHGIEFGWTWLARTLNMKPRKLTPLLICNFLKIAGHSLISKFGSQGKKLILALIENVIPIMPQSSIASTTKLKLFLDETFLKKGNFPANPKLEN